MEKKLLLVLYLKTSVLCIHGEKSKEQGGDGAVLGLLL